MFSDFGWCKIAEKVLQQVLFDAMSRVTILAGIIETYSFDCLNHVP